MTSQVETIENIRSQFLMINHSGLYNGTAIIIGGGLGPAVMSPFIGDSSGRWIILAIAMTYGILMMLFFRRYRY